MAGMSPFFSADDLLAATTRGDRMIILDSHWAPQDNASWDAYVSQHIPGAFWCDPLRMLAGTPSPETGRNPLPNPAMLQHFVTDWGISPGVPVRIYDTGRMFWAARAWWVLRWAGVEDVKIISGGTPAWEAAGGDVAGGIGCLRGRGTFEISSGGMPTIELEELDDWVAAGNLLVDVRGEGRFIGRREPHDRRAGHVPGAVNFPVELLLETGGIADWRSWQNVWRAVASVDRTVSIRRGSPSTQGPGWIRRSSWLSWSTPGCPGRATSSAAGPSGPATGTCRSRSAYETL